MTEDKIYCKPTITEMHRTLNISDIMDNIDTYSNKQSLACDKWMADKFQFVLYAYPKGDTDEVDKVISIYLQVTGGNPKENKHWKVKLTMKQSDESFSFIHTIDRYKIGRGWPHAISHSDAKNRSNIDFIIKLYHYPLFTELPSQSFEQQLEKVHLMSQ
eukprot:465311_1